MHTPDAYANGYVDPSSGNSNRKNPGLGEIIVIGALTIPCIGLGMWIFPKKSKIKNVEKVPVTSVLFDEESVDLIIDGNKMEVNARFEYQNTTEKKLQMDLLFPFSNSIQSSIHDISILLIRQDPIDREKEYVPLKYNIYNSFEISFDFILQPMERVVLKVHYLEDLFENKAEYIVTTIKRWRLPVAHAEFTVRLPSNKKSPVFSLEDGLVDKIQMEEFDLYKFRYRNLYPDKEFQVVWND
jgi:hypothetical protein